MSIDPYTPPKPDPEPTPDSEHIPGESSLYSCLTEILFSFRGRIGRSTFWHWTIVVFFAFNLLLGLTQLIFPPSYEDFSTIAIIPNPMGTLIGILISIPTLWINFALQVKRWHDLSKSAWWQLLWLNPLLGPLWAIGELGFVRGTPHKNQYGKAFDHFPRR